jgi:ankyrin repeat protein
MSDQAFLQAVRRGQIQEMQNLLNNGANVNAVDEDGTTALMLAIAFSRVNIVRELLANPKIDLSVRDSDGNTALDLANGQDEDEDDVTIRDLITDALDASRVSGNTRSKGRPTVPGFLGGKSRRIRKKRSKKARKMRKTKKSRGLKNLRKQRNKTT